jgi:hypothetical protein
MSTEQRMPFGKFKGVPIGEIETSYLQWLHKTVALREPIKSVVAAALAWKPVQMPLGVAGSTPTVRTQSEVVPTASLGASKGVSGGSPHREAARPKRAWKRPEDEDLSAYYSNGVADEIPW